MSLLETAWVFSTSKNHVYLAKGIDPTEAETHLKEQIDWEEKSEMSLYYEGKLTDLQYELSRDGIALLNP